MLVVFVTNPFAELSVEISPAIIQSYIVVMILLVMGGTLIDIVHKKSAQYFFNNWQTIKSKGTRHIGVVETISLAGKTVVVDVLTTAEFTNPQRRTAHLLTMYGFLAYVISTALMVFLYPTPATPAPAILLVIWYLSLLMICAGGYWFWFFMRVDVAAEGKSPLRFVRADLFIVSLLASASLGLIWGLVQSAGNTIWSYIFLAMYLIATTILFGSIPWSKFAHMFYKPAAAYQKRVEQANGSRRNLPPPSDAPAKLGSGRQLPRNY